MEDIPIWTPHRCDHMIGAKHEFEDGHYIHVIQIKLRDTGYMITYDIKQGPYSLPRRFTTPLGEFLGTFKHLFQRKPE